MRRGYAMNGGTLSGIVSLRRLQTSIGAFPKVNASEAAHTPRSPCKVHFPSTAKRHSSASICGTLLPRAVPLATITVDDSFRAFLAMITPLNGTCVSATTKRIPPSSFCDLVPVHPLLRHAPHGHSSRFTSINKALRTVFRKLFSFRSLVTGDRSPARPLLLLRHAFL
jgi:hypothetical protein